ncbi:MAG: hypothetical protein LBV60_25825 [Streptomyces sp.]|jgi:hypothetical protein|nr:hypothetical protein [Streptomyces sp.]
MTLDSLTTWAVANPWPAAATTAVALAALGLAARRILRAIARPPVEVVVAAAGALVCTALSADTSWRFAGHWLDMADLRERVVLFAAAEIAVFSCAVMARANKKATTTDDTAGSPGVPGTLMWVITGILVIPCYAESGLIGGTVRAAVGPVMAGILWHLAMGLEIRVARPAALSGGLLPTIGRELRERLLSRLGLAVRDRSAEQISRDRATARAVRLASRPRLHAWGRRRLAAAVARAAVGNDGEQRHRLLRDLAARRTSDELRTVPIVSPWASTPVLDEPYPRTPAGLASAVLRRLDPFDAVLRVQAAHPDTTPAELSSLCTEYGVPVTETQVRIATRHTARPAQVHAVPELPALPEPEIDHGRALVLDLAPAADGPNPMAAPVPVPAAVLAAPQARAEVHARVPDAPVPEAAARTPQPAPVPDAGYLDRARTVDAEYRREYGRPASIRHLKSALGIGQARAEQLRDALAERPTP